MTSQLYAATLLALASGRSSAAAYTAIDTTMARVPLTQGFITTARPLTHTFVRVQGRSGCFSLLSRQSNGHESKIAQVCLKGIKELDEEGNIVGKQGSDKHSVNTFASQDFAFTTSEEYVRGREFCSLHQQRFLVDPPVFFFICCLLPVSHV